MLKTIYLIDINKDLVKYWKKFFINYSEVVVLEGDYFQQPADVMVSPANSFGIMDGGIDLPIRDNLGFRVQRNLQKEIIDNYHGELPVGSAIIIKTDSKDWPFLVSAPTMRVPEDVSFTLNPYLAFRAALLEVIKFNKVNDKKLTSLVCCGMGTGYGHVHPKRCAALMRAAYQTMLAPSRIPSFSSIHEFHYSLQTS